MSGYCPDVNLILVESAEIGSAGTIALDGRRARHAREILGVTEGARVRIGAIRGPTGHATVTAVGGDRVTLRADEHVLAGEACPPPEVDVIVALPRPKVVKRVVQTLASLGVRRIDLVNSWRVHKSYFSTDRIAPDALRADLVLGCEQGGTTWLPDIAVHPLLMSFIRETLPSTLEGSAHRLVAHPRATSNLEDVFAPGTAGRAVVAVGPEGGWIEREVETFVERGFAAVALGPRIMRVETAAVALLSQLELLRRMRPAGQ